jgi:response regulator RpfG family c-di-GMP phosphodiesterase
LERPLIVTTVRGFSSSLSLDLGGLVLALMRSVIRPLLLLTGVASGLALGVEMVRERRTRARAERFASAALESLLRAIDANDPQTGAHVRRVAEYALIIADALDVSESERRTIELASLFHDVGKIHEAMFDIVHETRQLTPAEREALRTHPARGADVLTPIASFHPQLAVAVLTHHERWDGSGYPKGLRGTRIPLAARIVMIADTFDAVTQHRRYRDGRSTQKAAEIICEGAGAQFDPDLVQLMMQPPVFERITRAYRAHVRRGNRIPNRKGRIVKKKRMPDVEIRWRTRTRPPAQLGHPEGLSSATP